MSPTGAFDDEFSENQEDFYGLGYIDFADSRYLITKSSVIIGRPGDDHLTLGEVSDGSDGLANGNGPSRKRKRSDDDEDMGESGEDNEQDEQSNARPFKGGLGGPQEHGFSYYDDNDTNYIYVWPPANKETGLARNIKAISKRHLRLTLTAANDWLLDVLGRNGVLVNHDFYPCGSHTWLDHGDVLWFAGVQCQFNIPAPDGDEVLYSDEHDSMSGVEDPFPTDPVDLFDSQSEDDENLNSEDDDDDEDDDEEEEEEDDDDDDDEDDEDDQASNVPVEKPLSRIKLTTQLKSKPKQDKKVSKPRGPYRKRRKEPASESDEEDEEGDEGVPNGKANGKKTSKVHLKTKGRKSNAGPASSPTNEDPDNPDDPSQKKRGPGRPPKDGVMSKRARRALEKAAELENGDGVPKRKAKPRKSSELNGEEAKSATKKINKKSKRAAEEGDESAKKGETNATEDKPKDKEEAPPPPPREPSPKETDFTEEQLMKPDRPYSVCLYKVLSESSRPLALPEIYDEFKKRWPYYKFRVSGEGWQSSIRHNLQSTKCVVQAGRHGKGHLWTVDPNIPLDHRTTNRINPPSFSHPYYGAAGKPAAPDFQGQGQQANAMRPQNMAGFQGHQTMATYQTPYSAQATPYNFTQRPPGAGQQTGVASTANANNSPAAGIIQQKNMQGQRNPVSGTAPTGVMNPSNVAQATASKQPQPAGQQRPGGASTMPGPMPQQNTLQLQQQASSVRPASVTNQVANSGQTQTVGNPQAPKTGTGSALPMDESLMRERLQVFDQFRSRLLGMAQNDNQRRYYVDILDQGQQWCSKNTRMGATYDGPRSDIGQIVKAFQEAWEGHLRKKGLLKDQGARPLSGSPAPPAATANKNASVRVATNSAAPAVVAAGSSSTEPAAVKPVAVQTNGVQASQSTAAEVVAPDNSSAK